MKPQLANDAQLDKVRFPCIAQPKIDGVRALNLNGTLVGRSLDEFKGFGITEYFSRPEFIGFDGEMTLGDSPSSSERLCSLTTGAMSRFKDMIKMPDLHWWVFDLVTPETVSYRYTARQQELRMRLRKLHPDVSGRIHLVESDWCIDPKALQDTIAAYAEAGYEGTIIRNPDAAYKPGRPTLTGQQLWRVKPWADFEIEVTGITQGQTNTNAAKKNTLGRTERSSAKSGMVLNGQVGSIQGRLLADFHDPLTGKLLFARGLEVTAGSGEMSVAEATHYFENQHLLINQVAKVKHMTHGVKDLPRFPTFVSLRDPVDMS